MILIGKEIEREAVLLVAKLMLNSIRTAPKALGRDTIYAAILLDEDLKKIAEEMRSQAKTRGSGWERDAANVEQSSALCLIGVKSEVSNLNCGACGFKTCEEHSKAMRIKGLDFEGPTCIIKAIDLGIALGSAVKTASMHNVDNRIFYRAGAAAKKLGYLKEANLIIAIPLSATGKNLYFDRKP
jgi:uncharacterized ferredoxin-like protein